MPMITRRLITGCAVLCCAAIAYGAGPGALKAAPDKVKEPALPSVNAQGVVSQPVTRDCTPPAVAMDITIVTDDYPTETTWEVAYQDSGTVIAQGGPFDTGGTTYEAEVCVDPTGCYKFTIYDTYGDGIYDPGGYSVEFDGTLLYSNIGSGWDGFDQTIEFIGDGCAPPDGACCVEGDCVATNTELDCTNLGGDWFEGEDCANFTGCPQPPTCPGDSLFGQRAVEPDDSWSFGTSEVDANGTNYFRAESFTDTLGDICDIHWWGLQLYNSGVGWANCTDSDPTFEIKFYRDTLGAPGAEIASYMVQPVIVPTGLIFDNGTPFEMLYFSVDQLTPCLMLADHRGAGWVSIQGYGDTTCWFLWANSPFGDGSSYLTTDGTVGSYLYDNSVCLTGAYTPQTGACCIDGTATCTETVELIDCITQGGRFVAGTCADFNPPCGELPGACCHPDGTCEVIPELNCADSWLGPETTCDMCPCVVPCPPGVQDEQEACGADTNGGCLLDVPAFEDLKCGDTFCGTIWAANGTRDTDWYEVITTEDNVFTMTMEAEFPVVFGLVEQILSGDPNGQGCDNITGNVNPYTLAGECEQLDVVTDCLPAGTYWFFVSHQDYYDAPCDANNPGNHYVFSFDCAPCVVPTGACCLPNGDCADDQTEDACLNQGGTYQGDDTDCANVNCPQPPPNDECQNAEPITVLPGGIASVMADNSLATDDGAPTCGTSSPGHGMWYVITGTGNTITATTCSANTNFDTKLQVFGDCPPTLCVGGDDDDPNCLSSSLQSTYSWCSEAGATYYIHVGGYSANIGVFELFVLDDGVVCQAPLGRCCYDDPVQCLVNTASECADLTGLWIEGLDCNTPCPEPFAEDCDAATVVGALPFVVSFNNDSAVADGPEGMCDKYYPTTSGLMQNDAWYVWTAAEDCFATATVSGGYDIILVIRDNCVDLTELYCADAGATGEDEVLEFAATAGSTYYFQIGDTGSFEGGGSTLFSLTCSSGQGACCFYGGDCQVLSGADCAAAGGDYQGDGTLCDPNPCPLPCVECPPGALDEGEPCGEDTNGGCLSDPNAPIVVSIACGDTVCGTAWAEGGTRDTDWYEIVTTEPAIFTMSVEAEFEVVFGPLESNNPGSGDCADLTGYVSPYATAAACEEGVSVTSLCLPAGTHWFFVGPTVYDGIPCTAGEINYVMTITCESCEVDPYCPASGGCDEYIENVSIIPIDNTTACEGYAAFLDQKTRMVPGNSYSIEVLVGNAYTSDLVNVWIDWDQDHDLLDETAVALTSGGTDLFTGMIDCPAAALPGDTRMRVRLEYSSSVGPCGASEYGEVEDYTVNVGQYELGDMNCDGWVNNGDIDAFLLALDDYAAYVAEYPCDNADCNLDGVVDNADIDPFVIALIAANLY